MAHTREREIIAANVGKAFVDGHGAARSGEDGLILIVGERPCAFLVLRIGIAHGEALLRLDGGLVDLDVVRVDVGGRIHIFAPGNLRLRLVVEAHGSHAEAHPCVGLGHGNGEHQSGPGCRGAHEHGLAAFLLGIELKVGGVDVDVVAGLACGLVVGHIEDHLAVHTALAVVEHGGRSDFGCLRLSGCSAGNGQFAEQQVQIRGVGDVEGYQRELLAAELCAHGEGLLNPFLVVGGCGLVEHLERNRISLLAHS